MNRTDTITNVPDVFGRWYLAVVEFAAGTPRPVRIVMAHFTELGVVLLAALLALVWWHARRGTDRAMALTLAGGAGVVVSYGLSEWAKTYLDAERPCRTFAHVVIVAGECPPPGDWSFPSNHSTIAGALATALLLTSWRIGLPALAVGAAAAFSRVFVGVHYPHDVAAGFLLGAGTVLVLAPALVRPSTGLVARMRERPLPGRILTAGRSQSSGPASPA
ncbi:phosphatase PAP2 family protein [Couchioplanes caeruleus subsp. azureus]|nr:phosphatase PAP2 family protein [Couchioplanes caeruleus subsp. azureus]